jgi:two-component system, NtrC family, sensor kinase
MLPPDSEPQPPQEPGERPSSRGSAGDYERWFRVMDAQMRVLERERQKLAAVMNHADAGFVVMDADRRIVWSNEAVARLFGLPGGRAAVEGRHCSEVVCGCATACDACPAGRPFQSGAVAHEEIQRSAGGRARYIYATAMPIASPEGSVEQTLVMLQDISDLRVLRASEEALRSSEERLRSIFSHAAAGMAMLSSTGELLEVNPALCALLGYAPSDLCRLSLADVLYPEDRERVLQALAEARASSARPVDLEIRYVARHGSIVWGRTGASWIRDAEGHPSRAVLLVQDITELKELERELRQAEKMSAVGLLVSGVAHELNNPLAGVLGYAQLLLRQEPAEGVRRGLDAIQREAERCKRIVQNLQTFARKHKPQEGETRLNDLLRAALELRSYQLGVDNIRVVTELDEDLPVTRGDGHQLQQVFLNLIVNAHQAMLATGRGGTLTLRSCRRGPDLVVEIQDDGPGIPAVDLGRIFDPFFTTKDVGHGTGLGLSICYGIVKEHEGRITARNAAGAGAVFTVEIPLRDPRRSTQAPPPPPLPVLRSERVARPATRGTGRILVVDDEASVLDVAAQALRLDGHDVRTAGSARAALELVAQEAYDVIVSDLRMPGMSGQEMYERLASDRPEQARRVIFSTGDTLSPQTREFLERAPNRCLSKPFAIDELRALVNEVMDTPAGRQDGPS